MKLTFIIGKFSTYLHGQIDVEKLFRVRAITGSESSFFNVVRGLAERGHDVTVEGDFTNAVDKCEVLGGARIVKIDEGSQISSGSDDAYVSLNEPDQFRRLPAHAIGMRYLHHQYNDFGNCRDGWYDLVDVTVGLSPVQMRHLQDLAGIHSNRITWIPNSIEPDLFKDLANVVREPHSAVWSSSPDRGLHRLLEIWPDVRKKVPDAVLRVCYRFEPWYETFKEDMSKTGQRARYIHECFRRYGTKGENGIVLMDAVPNREMARLLGTSAVLPYTCEPMSFTEGFSVSIMDACAAGALPIISDADAIGDIYKGVAHVISGKPSESREAWIDSIVRAMTFPEWHQAITSKAKVFSKFFERPIVADLWEMLLTRNLDKRGRTHDLMNMPATIDDYIQNDWFLKKAASVEQAASVDQEPSKAVVHPRPIMSPDPMASVEKVKSISRKLRVAVIMGKLSSSIHGVYDIDTLYDEGLLTGTGSNFFNIIWGLAERGHQVDAFCESIKNFLNHPKLAGANVYSFDLTKPDETYDAYISINEPDVLRDMPKNKLKICAMWLNDFSFCKPDFNDYVDVYACPSYIHARHLATSWNIDVKKFVVVPLSFNAEFFADVVERRASSIAYCSSPDRGLHHILEMFGDIKKQVPDANLRIYYRFQPWYDSIMASGHVDVSIHKARATAIGKSLDEYGRNGENGVYLIGPVPSKTMAKELLATRVMAYTCDPIMFTEGFSVSIMDACAAGCVPIVAGVDALPEVYSGAVYMIPGKPNEQRSKWVEAIVAGLKNDEFANTVRAGARAFSAGFTRQKMAVLWESLINERRG
jgi:glycosyltransferase involved in cell wall biosynthesis